jgi:hypothetical protein
MEGKKKKKKNTHSVKHGPMNASVMLNHDDDAMQVGKKDKKGNDLWYSECRWHKKREHYVIAMGTSWPMQCK